MIFLICLLLSTTQNAKAENYLGNPGSEVVSDIELSAFRTSVDLTWKGDAFDGVPGFSNPHPIAQDDSTLQATMPGEPTSLAVVNDKVVAVGEKVNGKKVRKIGANYVLLEKDGSVRELNLDDKPVAPAAAGVNHPAMPDLLNGLQGTPSNLLGNGGIPNGAKSTNRSPASQKVTPALPEGIINIQERLVK